MKSLSELLEQGMNTRIKGYDPKSGIATVEKTTIDGEVEEFQIDPKLLAKQLSANGPINGVNVEELPLSSSSSPIKDSGLSFMQQMEFAESKSPTDQFNFLRSRFGKDNVAVSADGFKVKKEDGNWYEGAPSEGFKGAVAEFLGSSGTATATSIAGAKVGASAGSVFGPVGAFGGGILGAGVGAIVGKIANVATAYKAGIRTEYDASEVAQEVGKEALFNMAGEAIPALWALKSPRMLAKPLSKLATMSEEFGTQGKVAETLSSFTNVPSSSVHAGMQNPQLVAREADRAFKWRNANAAGLQKGINPLIEESVEVVDSGLKKVEDYINRRYADLNAKLSDVARSTAIPVEETIGRDLEEILQGTNIMRNGKYVPDKLRDLPTNLIPADERALKAIIDDYNKLRGIGKGHLSAKDVGIASFDDVNTYLRKLSNFTADSAKYSTDGYKLISTITNAIDTRLEGALAKINPKVAAEWNAVRTDYATINPIKNLLKEGLERPEKTQELLNILLSEKGLRQKNVLEVLSKAGALPDNMLRTLIYKKAGLDFSYMYRTGQTSSDFIGGVVSPVASWVGLNPTSPLNVINKMNQLNTLALSTKSLLTLSSMGKASEMLKNLPLPELRKLVASPEAMEYLRRTAFGAGAHYSNQAEELTKQGMNTINGQQ